MSTAGTAGELGGRVAGGWIGGIIGSFIPPPGLGTLMGRAVGSRLGGMAGRAAATALQDHINSMEAAEGEAEETDRVEGTAIEDEACKDCAAKCQQAANDTKHALYNNKRDPNNPSGFHGYLNRMIEQMCGAEGPGTDSWNNHINELRGAQRELNKACKPFTGSTPDCDPSKYFTRDEREIINKIIANNGKGTPGWSPTTIPHKGREHPDCQTFTGARDTARMRDYLRIIRPTSGSSGNGLIS